MKWEYFWGYKPSDNDIDERLAKFGEEGWELCGINDGKFFFKRPLTPNDND